MTTEDEPTYLVLAWTASRAQINAGEEALQNVAFPHYAVSSIDPQRSELTLYIPEPACPPAIAASLADVGLDVADAHSTIRSQSQLLEGFLPDEPVELTDGVWIDPTGKGLPVGAKSNYTITLPTSAAFGDGRHPTTRMGSAMLMGMDPKGMDFIDLGCGTGILGILARLRGAKPGLFTDIDDDSVRASKEALARNGLQGDTVVSSDLLEQVPAKPVPLVIANLYAELLTLVLADPKLDHILPSGTLIISGISDGKWPELQENLKAKGFTIDEAAHEAWWWGARCTR